MKNFIKVICFVMCGVVVFAGCTSTPSSTASDTSGNGVSAEVASVAESSEAASSAVSEAPPSSKAPIVQTELTDEVIKLNGSNYKLTFYDDFLGYSLDTSKWSLGPEQNRQDAGGKWDDDCTSLDGNGNLVLTAKLNEENKPISGAVRSKGKFEQAQGYFECRVRLQKAPGFWGAFWLMSSSMSYPWTVGNGAKDGIEIDIMESNNIYMKDINNALHWDGYSGATKSATHANHLTNCYDGEYHTFSLLWTETAYIWYIDGVEVFRSQEGYENYPGNCEEECYLKLTVEFGTWAGVWDPTMLPDDILVDYVKVYQKVD